MSKIRTSVHRKKEQATLFIQNGQLQEAARLLTPLCRKYPHDLEAWMLLAATHGQQGNLDGVTECAQHVLALAPNHAQAHSLLGNVLAAQGHHDKAMASYRKALRAMPDDPGILNNLGNALYLAGQSEEALEMLARVVQLRPDYADAHNNLGNICKALNRNSEAIAHFQRAIAINPALIEAHINLGDIMSDRMINPFEAEQCFLRALALDPRCLTARTGLASMLTFQGRLEEALEAFTTALHDHPGSPSAIAGMADACERLGRHEEAYRHIQQLLETGTANAHAIDVMLKLCRHLDCCPEAIRQAEALLADPALDTGAQQTLQFSLGHIHDKLGDFDRAFTHFRQGNDLSEIPFDPATHTENIDRMIASFSRVAMGSLPRATHDDTRPVFIVGMPRSGTTLTEQILASHPEVFAAGELNDFNNIVESLPALLGNRHPFPECIATLSQASADQLAQRYRDRLDSFSRTATRITDKMPHNFMNLGLIELLLPRARVIHCVRDPRDTCLSIYFHNFGWSHQYATRLERLGPYYRQYQRMMQHWEDTLDLPILTLHYANLIANQERVTRELIAFCDLDWNDRCLQYHESDRAVATASYDQVRQPIYTRSLARWKHYTQHIGPLLDVLGDTDTV